MIFDIPVQEPSDALCVQSALCVVSLGELPGLCLAGNPIGSAYPRGKRVGRGKRSVPAPSGYCNTIGGRIPDARCPMPDARLAHTS